MNQHVQRGTAPATGSHGYGQSPAAAPAQLPHDGACFHSSCLRMCPCWLPWYLRLCSLPQRLSSMHLKLHICRMGTLWAAPGPALELGSPAAAAAACSRAATPWPAQRRPPARPMHACAPLCRVTRMSSIQCCCSSRRIATGPTCNEGPLQLPSSCQHYQRGYTRIPAESGGTSP